MKYHIKTDSLRKVLSYEKGKIHSFVLPINELPDFDEWTGINPREQNLNSSVSKAVMDSLIDYPLLFVMKNRGITMMASDVQYDNKSEVLSFELKDPETHGLLDGGHTYRIIKEHSKELKGTKEHESEVEEGGDVEFSQNIIPMVRMEIIESDNITDTERVDIVKARNSSTQVKDVSIANLSGFFERIQKELSDKSFGELISYKENDADEEGGKKIIQIADILSYLKCFDKDFDRDEHPITAYSGKGSILRKFATEKEERSRVESLIPLLKDILELHDKIYLKLPELYNKVKKGSFGKLSGIIWVDSTAKGARKKKPTKLYFIDEESSYRIPSGFIYPFLAAFRANLDEDRGWRIDPDKLFEKIGGKLAKIIGERALELKNPNQLGKDTSVWKLCYQEAKLSIDEISRGIKI